MRISDWSSDVCSSDLARTAKRFETRVGLDDHPAGRPGLDDRLLLAYLAGRAVGAAERHAALQIGVDQPGGREQPRVAILFEHPVGQSADRKSTRLNSSH